MIPHFFNTFKNLFGRFWSTSEGYCEYYLKLDGYFYCQNQKCTFAVIRVRHKRTTETIAVSEIINDPEYLCELHPNDAFVIGLLANNDRNGIIDDNIVGWRKMRRSKEYFCFIKSEPVLEISKKTITDAGTEAIVLHSKYSDKYMEIPMIDLCKNQALLYALDSYEALSVGYDVSEIYARRN